VSSPESEVSKQLLGADRDLAALKDWIIESACEDDGYVAHLVGIASLIYATSDERVLRKYVTDALTQLADSGFAVVGPYDERRVEPVHGEALRAMLSNDQAWELSAESRAERIGYGITDEGERVDSILDANVRRASTWIYGQ
jgi:hypothetical protein